MLVRIEKACNHITDSETDECEANLPKIETVVVAKHQCKSTEKEVEDSLEAWESVFDARAFSDAE